MFDFIEKNHERRMLHSHLSSLGLELEALSPAITKAILQVLHRQVMTVSRKYNKPAHVVSENIIGSAAWGIAYCLLGPTKLFGICPEYREISEEVEMELVLSECGETAQGNVYQQVFSILLESSHCHPEVQRLSNRIRLTAATPVRGLLDERPVSIH